MSKLQSPQQRRIVGFVAAFLFKLPLINSATWMDGCIIFISVHKISFSSAMFQHSLFSNAFLCSQNIMCHVLNYCFFLNEQTENTVLRILSNANLAPYLTALIIRAKFQARSNTSQIGLIERYRSMDFGVQFQSWAFLAEK